MQLVNKRCGPCAEYHPRSARPCLGADNRRTTKRRSERSTSIAAVIGIRTLQAIRLEVQQGALAATAAKSAADASENRIVTKGD